MEFLKLACFSIFATAGVLIVFGLLYSLFSRNAPNNDPREMSNQDLIDILKVVDATSGIQDDAAEAVREKIMREIDRRLSTDGGK